MLYLKALESLPPVPVTIPNSASARPVTRVSYIVAAYLPPQHVARTHVVLMIADPLRSLLIIGVWFLWMRPAVLHTSCRAARPELACRCRATASEQFPPDSDSGREFQGRAPIKSASGIMRLFLIHICRVMVLNLLKMVAGYSYLEHGSVSRAL